nr:PREDICTED: glycerate kinase [Latimeria chalumnae]|eukprot:XP_005987088.2 PREDICTED: glycerate kinase [Latimeria chalumnae]
MAAAAEHIIGEHLVKGIISVPNGIQDALRQAGKGEMLLTPHSKIQVMEGAKLNFPDEAAMAAAGQISGLAEELTAGDLLLVLISGGGSALLPSPVPPITLQEKQEVTRLLASKGATIQELNTVRKSLSLLKGGGLARIAQPAQVVSLIMSDVIGDSLEIIASGPTVPTSHTVRDSLDILSQYGLSSSLPASVKTVLFERETRRLGDYSHVFNLIIGSNTISLKEARNTAERMGYATLLLSTAVCGEVSLVARFYSLLIQCVCVWQAVSDPQFSLASERDRLKEEMLKVTAMLGISDLHLEDHLKALESWGSGRPVCLLAGGETTVHLRGKGKGGRNQEMALRVAMELHQVQSGKMAEALDQCEVLFLSGGTDGQDGPTEAAGALSSPDLVGTAKDQDLHVEPFLANNDSYTFFSKFNKGANFLMTGLTGTNVMDVQAILIRQKK